MSLETLPTEILTVIVTQVVIEANLDSEFHHGMRIRHPPGLSCTNSSLQPLSTTSRNLREITLPILFKCVVVAAEDALEDSNADASFLEPLRRLHSLLSRRPHIAALASYIEILPGRLASSPILTSQSKSGMEQLQVLADSLALLPRATRLRAVYASSEEFLRAVNSSSLDAVDVYVKPEIPPEMLASDPKFLRKVWIKVLMFPMRDLDDARHALEAGMNIHELVLHPYVEDRQKIASLPFNRLKTIVVGDPEDGDPFDEEPPMTGLSDWLSSALQHTWPDVSKIKLWIHSKELVPLCDARGPRDWPLLCPRHASLNMIDREDHHNGVIYGYEIERVVPLHAMDFGGVLSPPAFWAHWTIVSLSVKGTLLEAPEIRAIAQAAPALQELRVLNSPPLLELTSFHQLADDLSPLQSLRRLRLWWMVASYVASGRGHEYDAASFRSLLRERLCDLAVLIKQKIGSMEQLRVLCRGDDGWFSMLEWTECSVNVRRQCLREGGQIETSVHTVVRD